MSTAQSIVRIHASVIADKGRHSAAAIKALHACETAAILAEITEQQTRQINLQPASEAWQSASRKLAPLFAEMARRQSEAQS